LPLLNNHLSYEAETSSMATWLDGFRVVPKFWETCRPPKGTLFRLTGQLTYATTLSPDWLVRHWHPKTCILTLFSFQIFLQPNAPILTRPKRKPRSWFLVVPASGSAFKVSYSTVTPQAAGTSALVRARVTSY